MSNDLHFTVPDIIEPIIGYREFEVRYTVDTIDGIRMVTSLGLFSPIIKGYRWNPGQNVASCQRRYSFQPDDLQADHGKAPNKDCACGLYAMHTPESNYKGYSIDKLFSVDEHNAAYAYTLNGFGGFTIPLSNILQALYDVEDDEKEEVNPLVFNVLIAVKAAGRLELHQQGFRAEYATPVALFVPTDTEEVIYQLNEFYCLADNRTDEVLEVLRQLQVEYELELLRADDFDGFVERVEGAGFGIPVPAKYFDNLG